ncbi:MAG: hypothetical protein QOE63_1309 [Acidimicrobiaceae bacterium]
MTARRDRDVVEKTFVNADWLAREPDLAAREAAALELLARADLPFATPELVALEGNTVVMSRLPGASSWAPPSIERFAALAVALHEVVAPPGFRRYRRYDISPKVPPWTARTRLWERAIEVAVRTTVDDAAACFIHRDHHAGNVLWVGDEVSGVVDFVEACIGPPEVDSARARINLVHWIGLDAAAQYARCPGIRIDPRWDVVDACDSISWPGTPCAWIEPFVASALSELG